VQIYRNATSLITTKNKNIEIAPSKYWTWT